jgi:hypothetical protein
MVKWIASAFYFNDPGFKSRFGNRNFSSIFHQFCNFGTIRTLIWWKHFPLSSVLMTDLLNFLAFIMRCLYVSLNEFVWKMCVVEACFGLSIAGVTCVGCVPIPSNYASLPCMQGPWCEMSVNEFPIGGSLVRRVT